MNATKTMLNGNGNQSDMHEDVNILSIYLKEINRIPMLTHEEEYKVAKLAAEGNQKARNRLVESNLRFVVNIAKKYQNQGLPLGDLINEGNIGLMNAIEKFDVDKGYHFISYAVWWIRQAILKAISEKSRTVRLPLNRANELMQIQKAQKSLMNESGAEPTMEEIGRLTQLDPSHVADLIAISKEMVSLDAPVFTDSGNSSVGDFIQDGADSPDDVIIDSALKEDINKVLATLSEKEMEILEFRFGLNGQHPMSLKEIGELYNLTKERIRQIEKKAIERLQQPSRIKMLVGYSA
ncbi:sigma-70 family RNA polymerase sigma factor [Parasphaerochaeta coccoides]|uniref:RNA polymerase, sigma 70 subunit, RpoD subfamily n=1 Tax=Parasphaerochaeta coccoides (strain ATCC BAA-1237 / DSM 17374 / SPN1) TaxID=760011 RepID=F4GKU4_PARC1|nr:RNA polymerase sigma factor RpoD/SigA [Parasphaerochaeta coccoides]AEC01857.1 RNA polymerase, sigma 70 subunit, RpoD subfamily [Parasphaerochaeta coccoides DSM 17374]